jgi:hypothetical protein
MASEIDICNLALGQLGSHTITSFADGTTESSLCATNYPIVRDAVLEARDWTFCTFETQLIEVVSPPNPPPEFSHGYAMPTECLLIRYCFLPVAIGQGEQQFSHATSEQRQQRPPWNRFGDLCWSSTSTLWARWLKRVTDTSQYTTNFIQTLATRLAFELAMPLTNKVEVQAQKAKEYEGKIKEASGRDGSQGTPQVIQTSYLTRFRY